MCQYGGSVFSTQYNPVIVLLWRKLTIITEEKCRRDVGVSNPDKSLGILIEMYQFSRWLIVTKEDIIASSYQASCLEKRHRFDLLASEKQVYLTHIVLLSCKNTASVYETEQIVWREE